MLPLHLWVSSFQIRRSQIAKWVSKLFCKQILVQFHPASAGWIFFLVHQAVFSPALTRSLFTAATFAGFAVFNLIPAVSILVAFLTRVSNSFFPSFSSRPVRALVNWLPTWLRNSFFGERALSFLILSLAIPVSFNYMIT